MHIDVVKTRVDNTWFVTGGVGICKTQDIMTIPHFACCHVIYVYNYYFKLLL